MKRDRDAIRSRLLRAAELLIAERGLDAINTNEVARAAGIGVGTFYSLFPDKYALADAVTLSAWEALGSALRTAGHDALAMTSAVVEFASSEPARFKAAFGRGPSGARSGRPAVALSTRTLARQLEAMRSSGDLDPELDPTIAARAWWSMISGALAWWIEDPRRADPEVMTQTLTRLHPAYQSAS